MAQSTILQDAIRPDNLVGSATAVSLMRWFGGQDIFSLGTILDTILVAFVYQGVKGTLEDVL